MNRWMGVSLVLAGVVVGLLLGGGPVPEARAGEGRVTCDWTWTNDRPNKNLGRDGAVKAEKAWAKLSAEGWRVVDNWGDGGVTLFERCR